MGMEGNSYSNESKELRMVVDDVLEKVPLESNQMSEDRDYKTERDVHFNYFAPEEKKQKEIGKVREVLVSLAEEFKKKSSSNRYPKDFELLSLYEEKVDADKGLLAQ